MLGFGDTKDYNEYSHRIWKEYEFYGWDAYSKGRIQVLERMLAKYHLYFTSEIRGMLEDKARENVRSEIERLERGE